MATLQDYLGITALRDAWPKWKANVIAINNQVIAHIAGTADKHSAQDITYTGDFVGKTEVKAALDQAKTEIDTIVVNASIDPEVAFARDSAVKGETFDTLDARIEEDEQDLVSYKADNTQYIKATGSDDSAIIQTKIDSSIGRKLVLLGEFITSTSINVPSNSDIEFHSSAKITNLTDNHVFIHNSDSLNANIRISKFNLAGNPSSLLQHGIYISGCDNVVVDHCTCKTFARAGIRVTNCTNSEVTCNNVSECGFTTSPTDKIGILIEGCSNSTISHNDSSDNTGNGIQLFGGNDNEISFNKCWRNTVIGIIGAGAIYKRLRVIGNSCCYNGSIITVNAEGGINFHGLTSGIISDNVCSFNKNYGIDINGSISGLSVIRSDTLLITNNVCTDNENIGLYAFGCVRITIDANICRNNVTNIQISGPSSHSINITNNQCHDSRGTNNIYIIYGKDILIENNRCGEIESNSTSTREINIASTVTGGILFGLNDFTDAKAVSSKIAVIACTRDKTDFKHKQIFVSDEITLSGAEFKTLVLLYPEAKYSCIFRAYARYTEASSGDTGVLIGIGSTIPDYWATATTGVSEITGSTQDLTLNRNGQLTPLYSSPWFYCAGGKVGAGKIKLVVEYVPNFPIYY